MTPEEYCQRKAAGSGSSFYYSFLFLPPERRRAITALYAFCREVDDVVDECADPQLARTKLAWWRSELAATYAGRPSHPVTQSLAEAVRAFSLPQDRDDLRLRESALLHPNLLVQNTEKILLPNPLQNRGDYPRSWQFREAVVTGPFLS